MSTVTKVEPIDRDLVIRLLGTPQDRSAMFAAFAREKLKEGEETNREVLGRVPPHKTFVDGSEGASEDSVRPDGIIVYEFELVGDLLGWVADQLQRHAPVKSGRFKNSFTLYADGTEVDIGADIPPADEYVFLNTQPYARKIERGESPQAPDGVFQVVAEMARARFGNLARIGFAFRSPMGGVFQTGRVGNRSDGRTPAITIKLK